MAETDPYEHDPFFKKIHDADWNACIGRQGHEENYLDGYIEAAIELADAIIEKKMFAKRDTLVLPILYNARHATHLLNCCGRLKIENRSPWTSLSKTLSI